MKYLIIFLLMICHAGFAHADKLSNYNVYFAGVLKHFDTAPENNEGNMEYFGLSRDFEKGNWLFETGGGTYIDSYHIRSYIVSSNISHDKYTYNWIRPVLSLACTNKGKEHNSKKRENICAPLPKIRLGKKQGLFSNFTYVPKYKNLTNGFIAIEFGYNF